MKEIILIQLCREHLPKVSYTDYMDYLDKVGTAIGDREDMIFNSINLKVRWHYE